jgi:hypothetical protein
MLLDSTATSVGSRCPLRTSTAPQWHRGGLLAGTGTLESEVQLSTTSHLRTAAKVLSSDRGDELITCVEDAGGEELSARDPMVNRSMAHVLASTPNSLSCI